MKYVVLRIKGKQYRVEEGKEFLVDKAEDAKAELLLAVNEDKVVVGKPALSKPAIKVTVVKDVEKGDRVLSKTFKAKTRFRKTRSSRPVYTRLKIGKFDL
jgi:ribosomal protein L21